MRGVVFIDLRQSRRCGQPAGRAAHGLKDHELVDPLHVAGQHASLLDREGHVAARTAEAGRVVGHAEVVIDRLGHADADKFIALLAAVGLHAVDGVHRVVAADGEEVADIEAAAARRGFPGKSASLSLWRQLPSAPNLSRPQGGDRAGFFRAQIDHLALHKAFDAVAHAERAADGRSIAGGLDDSGEAGVDHARWAAALADDGIALKHFFSS